MFNITETHDLKVWFTTDLHLDHQGPQGGTPLWQSRGYKSPSDMTQGIITEINTCVRRDDVLINLGDLCLNCSMEKLNSYLDQINCQNMYCMMGNHPNPHYKAVYRDLVRAALGDNYTYDSEVFPLRYKNMIYINHLQEMVVNGQLIVMCHYPLMVWNHSKKSAWCLVGHSHGSLPSTLPVSNYGKILDVGWDVFKRPVSFLDIKNIMDKKPMLSVDHHR